MSSKKTKYLNMHDWVGTDPWRRSEISENFQKLDDKSEKLDLSMAAATTTASQAKATAEGINAKAESALSNSTAAVSNANTAVQTASAADVKATAAKTTAEDALTKAQSADATAASVQNQFDQVVINGDSSIEAAQARVDTNGQTYTTLKQRLDSEFQQTTATLAETASRTLGYGTKLDRPSNPEIANLFFLTDKKKRIEYNGTNWQYLDGLPVDLLEIVDGNIYPESASYTTQTKTSGQSMPLQMGVDMTKDFIWYANIQLADNNDFAHFQFNADAATKIQLTFGYNWVSGVKDGASISLYDYSDASKNFLGSVDFFTSSHDIVIWYDHKWGFLNVYVDKVLIGSYKSAAAGTVMSTLNRASLTVGSGSTLLTVNYNYMAKPLVTAIGDSITAGAIKHAPNANQYAGVDIYNNSYPKHVSDHLKSNNIKNYFVVNKGVNSDTTTGMKNRFAADIVNTGCKYCLIHGGINDYTSNNPSLTVQNKKDMATTAVTSGIEPIILGVIPTKTTSVSTSHQYSKDVHVLENSSYSQFTYAELWQSLVGSTADVADDAKMDDTVHPNLTGYIAMVEKIKPLIDFI